MSREGTILVVDDNSDSLMLFAGILADEGYNVRPADGGSLALASAAADPPELIVLDVRMPDVDGFEVCRLLKDNNQTSAIPIILMSASNDPAERVEGLALGAVDFVSKPVLREELLARVRTHLELRHLRRDLERQVARNTAELRDTVVRLRQEIAERTHAENALSESEQRFSNMADTAPVLIWLSGPDRLCTFFNKQWLAFTGRTVEQELGNGWSDGVHPDDLERCLTTYTSAFKLRRRFEMDYRLRRADGNYRWVLDVGVPRFDSGGAFAGYVGSCIDITDRKQAKEEEFDRERLQSLRVVTSGIAHDFANLMGTILATAELAETEMDDGVSPTEEIQTIKALANRAVEIVRGLMIYGGQDRNTFEQVDVSQVVREMVALLRSSISKRATLHTHLSDRCPAVWENPTHIRQIVMNLIINASEALGGNDGAITITTSQITRAEERDSDGPAGPQPRDYLRIEVSDTGCGMTEEQRGKMFDPYFTTKRGGHGLGLAVVYGIVQSHGGAINVASAVGRGTMIEVLLPCLPVDAGKIELRSAAAAGDAVASTR